MSRMSELSQVLDEMIACGEGMIRAANTIKEIFTDTEEPEKAAPAKTEPKKQETKTYTFAEVRKAFSAKSHAGYTAQVKALIDVGHAVLGDYDICCLQENLREKLVGYHIHDNDGQRDWHWRFDTEGGIVDWPKFCQGAARFTPNAVMVLEYAQAEVGDYIEDVGKMEKSFSEIMQEDIL